MSILQRERPGPGAPVSAQGYRELFENNPYPMWVYDCETLRFLAVNDAAVRTYGYTHDEFLRMQINELHPKADKNYDSPVERTEALKSYRKKDGGIINVEISRYDIVLDDRSAVAEMCRDDVSGNHILQGGIRPSLDLEQRVRDRTAQLEAMNRELEAFCYSVSHDLRAPLRSIRGFSEVLLERYGSKVDARGQELLRRVCESSAIMDCLIEDLLKLSRVTRVELQRQSVNISAMAEAIAHELLNAEPSRSVQFSISPNLSVYGDERLLRVVMDNLLRNAWKFTSKRTDAKIEVGSTGQPERALFVKDDGAGFDMAYADKLFGVFQRLHSHDQFPGTGVGLAIVQRIVNRHGGRVWANGEVDRGATFYFTLSLPEC